jgi:Peptidase family S41
MSKSFSRLFVSILLSMPACPSQSVAQVATESPPPGPNTTVSRAERDELLTAIEANIRESYVFPEKAPGIIAALDKARRAGRYDTGDAGLLAERLTEDLLVSSADHHLYLNQDPQRYALAMQHGEAGRDAVDANGRRTALRDNSGLTSMTILPGNVRYLKISQFEWVPDETGTAYDDAMRFLRGADAIIIDLRGNPGGDSAAVRYLVSHFLDPDTLEYRFLEGTKPPVQMRALDYVPAGRIKDKPLYVLIDGGVASAAESFAYDVQQFKLGELVGEKTIGAANNNRLIPIAPGFMLSVSYGRPLHAVSGTNWEGVGVAPSVPIAAGDALDEAQDLALLRLKTQQGLSPQALADVNWALVAVESRLKPASLPAERLQLLAGHYGDFDIAFDAGCLRLARPHRPSSKLLLLTVDGLFAVDGLDRLRVQLTGASLKMFREGDPAPRIYPRTGAVPTRTPRS